MLEGSRAGFCQQSQVLMDGAAVGAQVQLGRFRQHCRQLHAGLRHIAFTGVCDRGLNLTVELVLRRQRHRKRFGVFLAGAVLFSEQGVIVAETQLRSVKLGIQLQGFSILR